MVQYELEIISAMFSSYQKCTKPAHVLPTFSTLLIGGLEENKLVSKSRICSKYFVQDCNLGQIRLEQLKNEFGCSNRYDFIRVPLSPLPPNLEFPVSPYFRRYFETPCIKLIIFQNCQTNSAILKSYWNFPNGLFNYIQGCNYSRLKLLFNLYVKRTVHRQDFVAKLNLVNHNGAPEADILNILC